MKEDNTVILTYIYEPNVQTGKSMESFVNCGYKVHNAFHRHRYMGNGFALKDFYKALKILEKDYKYVIYSDGGDTWMDRPFTPPDGVLIYSAEKACYPHPEIADQYPQTDSPWKYLNGGNFCAPISLMVEFLEKYNLINYKTDINGQYELSLAYLQAVKDGFPIKLDTQCEYFQTLAFQESGDLVLLMGEYSTKPIIFNPVTNSYPYIFHGNGRVDMDWIYKNLG